jgi:hypothetical protein
MLFLAGVRYRTQAEATQRMAFALTSLVEELSLSSEERGSETGEPKNYQDNGLVLDGIAGALEAPSGMDGNLFAYPDLPGIFYRVMTVSDMHGKDEDPPGGLPVDGLPLPSASATIHARVLVLAFATDDSTVTFADLQRRFQIDGSAASTPDQLAAALVDRGLALQCETVILRRPSWL